MIVYSKELGFACQSFRYLINETQNRIAEETGYSVESISAFENGRNNNAAILLWYFCHGLSVAYLRRLGGVKDVSAETDN